MVWGIVATVIAVVSSAASYIAQRQAKKRAKEAAEDAAAVQVSGHNSNRGLYIVYGKALVGSTTIWKKVSKMRAAINVPNSDWTLLTQATDTTGTGENDDRRWFYRVVSICQGPVEDITNVLIDGQSYQDERFRIRSNAHFAASIYKGEASGDHWDRLINRSSTEFREWDSTKEGKEVCYAVERLFLHKKSPAFQGEPDTQYEVTGRRLYDPRLDSTISGGVGTHRYNDVTTWAWSDNPALALLDLLMSDVYGRGLDPATDINLQSFQAAADACDTSVTVPSRLTNTTGGTVSVYIPLLGISVDIPNLSTWDHYRPNQVGTTQKRFTCNVALDPDKPVKENVETLLNVFRAQLPRVNGQYEVVMEDVATSVMSLTDDDIIGGLQIQSGDRSQRTNRATVKFLNANKNHREDQVSWPGVNDAQYTTYINEDQGEALHQQYTLHGVTDYYQAEDIAEFIVRDSRTTLTARGKFHPRTMRLVPGDVIDLTYDSASWVDKYFKVVSVNIDTKTLETQLELREYDSSVYTWNASRGNEPLGFSWSNETFNGELEAPVIGTITSAIRTNADGSTAIEVTVPYSGVPAEATIAEILWAPNGSDDWQSVVIPDPDGTQSSVVFQVPRDNQLYDIRLRYRTIDSASGGFMYSIEDTDTHTTPTLTGTHLGSIESGATRGGLTNQMPPGFGDFETIPVGATGYFNASLGSSTYNVTDSLARMGARCLRFDGSVSGGGCYTAGTAQGLGTYNISILPNRRWLVTLWCRSQQAGATFGSTIHTNLGSFIGNDSFTITAANTWYQAAFECDATAYSETLVRLRFYSNNLTAGNEVYVDGVCLYDVTDHPGLTTSNYPTAFAPGGQVVDWGAVVDDGNRPEDGATYGARVNSVASTEVFRSEDWGDNDLNRWYDWAVSAGLGPTTNPGVADMSVVTSGAGATGVGNYALRLGNNSGNDMYWGPLASTRNAVPVTVGKVYRMTVVLARIDTTGTVYLGPWGLKGDVRNGNGSWVNTSGSNSQSSQHYFVASAQSPIGWTRYTAYFTKNGVSYSNSPAGTLNDPKVLHPDVEYVVPGAITNYNATNGRVDVDFVEIVEVDGTDNGGAIDENGDLVDSMGLGEDGGLISLQDITRSRSTSTGNLTGITIGIGSTVGGDYHRSIWVDTGPSNSQDHEWLRIGITGNDYECRLEEDSASNAEIDASYLSLDTWYDIGAMLGAETVHRWHIRTSGINMTANFTGTFRLRHKTTLVEYTATWDITVTDT